jgi:SAM-dependent methyltransferase
MKDYQSVVKERYNGREKGTHIYDNIYSMINPLGFYGYLRINKALFLAFNRLREMGIDLSRQRILDVGCGSGLWTRYISEISLKPENLCGMDLSEYRIHEAKRMNSKISYFIGDLVTMPYFKVKWDIITAFVVFMHLKTELQILSALERIADNLTPGGLFFWYELNSKSHFTATQNAESSGFNAYEMDSFCTKVGLQKIASYNLFRNLFWKKNSYFLYDRVPPTLISFMEKILPGNPACFLFVYKKQL